MQRYILRSLEPVLKKAASQFPALVLTGPRQSGKTTLLKTFRKDLGPRALPGYVVHPGDIRLSLGSDVTALPFAEL